MGSRYRLQTLYPTYNDWKRYSDIYNLAQRLGFNSAKDAYTKNPIIQGGTLPDDFQIAPANHRG
jgi:hypothetical protein